MKSAFISYRRQDSPGYVRALYDRLAQHYSANKVFMDVDDIQLGSDFVDVLDNNLKSCAVMLVVIGSEWLNIRNASGERRLDNPADFVRLEVARALQRGIPVIPILVSGAPMPSESDLPDDLKPLARRQALELNNKNYDHSIADLIKSLEKYLGEAKPISNRGKTEDVSDIENLWYKQRSFVYLWLLIAPPVGIYGLWKSSGISNALKIILGVTPLVLLIVNFEAWLGLLFVILIPAALIYLWREKGIEKKTKVLYTVFSFLGAMLFAGVFHGIFFPDNLTGKEGSDGGVLVTEKPSTVEAGFDCNAAGTTPEKAICASDEAKQADKDMVDAYKAFKAKMPPATHDEMWKLQKIWLQWRDNHIKHTCYTKPTKQLASKCITKFYKEHTATLNTYLSTRFIEMRVFDPPSNIRDKPYGEIICAAPKRDEKITIYTLPITDKDDDYWYWTEYCGKGKWGLIHDSQVRPL